ncbi:pentatricopeptide repeat-containing protein At3g51320 [Olea europaea var. sylvestris]|uniref:pentatricopeptide repeat-containing protein At3g51320 n=1 Tax=Olea europaea var. sylvestris TaxID=158386 RepID=UPI000C1D5E8D|nr:pentatricopeptide repeat-containing protein At3g51320 [Olea europaea var. sylvestris]
MARKLSLIDHLLRFRISQFTNINPSKPFSYFSTLSSPDLIDTSSNYCKEEENCLYFLNSCRSLSQSFQILANSITSGLFRKPSFYGRILKLFSTISDDIDYVMLIFKRIEVPDTFCVNTVIKAYSCSFLPYKAVGLYFEMLQRGNLFPNSFTYPPLFSACAKMGCLSLGQKCHGQALKFGVDGVLPVQNSLIHLYACCGHMGIAEKVYVEMPVRDLVSWNTIVDGFAKVGEMGRAHHVFDAMPERNVVSWNVMITGYLNFGNPGNALKLFREMARIRFSCNDTTLVSVLTACGRSNRLKEGRSVHAVLVRIFLNLSLIIDTAMINMYGKGGRVDVARIIFDRMLIKNLVCWNAMILGYCIHGNPVDGISLYTEMVDKTRVLGDSNVNTNKNIKLNERDKIIPDEVTFIGILCACARKGMLVEGRKYFSQMVDVFHVKPNFAHYWCMANLMANVGLVQEAVNILRNIPVDKDVSPESSLWAGLLGSSRFQGDLILGEQIAKELIEQDPQKFSYYMLLVNIYAVAGKWEEVSRIRDMMKERGIKRVPGSTLEDLKDVVHTIKLGDRYQQITQMALMK